MWNVEWGAWTNERADMTEAESDLSVALSDPVRVCNTLPVNARVRPSRRQHLTSSSSTLINISRRSQSRPTRPHMGTFVLLS